MAFLPAFGMENDIADHIEITYPCDNCQEEKTELNYIAIEAKTKKCNHIICQKCDDIIGKTQSKPTVTDTCKYCAYFFHTKNKQCWQNVKSAYTGMEWNTDVSAEYFKTEHTNRALPDIPDTTLSQEFAGKPIELPTDNTETEQNMSHCDCCANDIDHNNPIQTDHSLNKLEGTCSYLLCGTCQAEIATTVDKANLNENTQKLYGNCKTCSYFDTLGLERKWNPVTYPCDNCHEGKALLNRYSICNDDGKQCLHILCKECNDTISSWKKPTDDKALSHCKLCYYFYKQHKKQCWKPTNNKRFSDCSSTNGRASYFRQQYPNRVLPDIADAAMLPQEPAPQNPGQPAPQNPDNPGQPGQDPMPPINNFVNNNKLKWLGLTCVAGVVCYGAYKAYIWWKGEDAQEKDADADDNNADNEQEDLKKKSEAS